MEPDTVSCSNMKCSNRLIGNKDVSNLFVNTTTGAYFGFGFLRMPRKLMNMCYPTYISDFSTYNWFSVAVNASSL